MAERAGPTRPAWLPRSPLHWLGLGATLLLGALAFYALGSYAVSRDVGADVAAYWNAAERLKSGGPLYVAAEPNASELYRYSPWFAYAWIPLTQFPRDAVVQAWVGLMVIAAAVSTVPLLLRGPAGLAAFGLLAPLQLQGAVFGNIQPLLVLLLMWSVERRYGPVAVALAASLKAVPLLLAVVWLARGDWQRALVALALTGFLVVPVVLHDLSGYSTEPGPNQLSLAGVWFPAFIALALAAVLASWRLANTPYRWLAAAVAMLASLPRLLTYEIGFLLIGMAPTRTKP